MQHEPRRDTRPGQSPAQPAEPTPHPWVGELEIATSLALELVRAQFPALDASRIVVLGRGWDNTAFLIDDELVFRFPRKQCAVALLETEARVLPALAPCLPMQIPAPEWVARPTPRFPWPFVGYRRVPGEPASAARLTERERIRAARPLGAFLNRLHATDAADLDVPGDALDRDDFARRLPHVKERLGSLVECGAIEDPEPWAAVFAGVGEPERSERRCLVHGDLYARHLLVDANRELTGIIDWGDVHVGDPAMDLMIAFAFLPPQARDDFFRAYGSIDDRTFRVARLRATFHAISVTWYGAILPDDELLQEGLLAMRYVLEG